MKRILKVGLALCLISFLGYSTYVQSNANDEIEIGLDRLIHIAQAQGDIPSGDHYYVVDRCDEPDPSVNCAPHLGTDECYGCGD